MREMRGGKLNDPRFGSRMRGEGQYAEAIERLFTTTARRVGLLRDERMEGEGKGGREEGRGGKGEGGEGEREKEKEGKRGRAERAGQLRLFE